MEGCGLFSCGSSQERWGPGSAGGRFEAGKNHVQAQVRIRVQSQFWARIGNSSLPLIWAKPFGQALPNFGMLAALQPRGRVRAILLACWWIPFVLFQHPSYLAACYSYHATWIWLGCTGNAATKQELSHNYCKLLYKITGQPKETWNCIQTCQSPWNNLAIAWYKILFLSMTQRARLLNQWDDHCKG